MEPVLFGGGGRFSHTVYTVFIDVCVHVLYVCVYVGVCMHVGANGCMCMCVHVGVCACVHVIAQ